MISNRWVIRHRLELHPDGSIRFTRKSLIDLGLYFDRPARELIYMKRKEHTALHVKVDALSDETRKKLSNARVRELNPMWGKHHTEETRQKMSAAMTGKLTNW